MGALLGVHPIVPWSMLLSLTQHFTISSRVGPKSASCRYMFLSKMKLARMLTKKITWIMEAYKKKQYFFIHPSSSSSSSSTWLPFWLKQWGVALGVTCKFSFCNLPVIAASCGFRKRYPCGFVKVDGATSLQSSVAYTTGTMINQYHGSGDRHLLSGWVFCCWLLTFLWKQMGKKRRFLQGTSPISFEGIPDIPGFYLFSWRWRYILKTRWETLLAKVSMCGVENY